MYAYDIDICRTEDQTLSIVYASFTNTTNISKG